MCFAPQRRALFRHLNFQKWSDHVVFCTFSLGNVLRATTACTFSTSQLPKVVRDRQFLTLLTWKCASRHNGVHFFISHLASWVRTRRFSEPTFRPSGATNHWKNTVNRDFPTFSRLCIFFLLIFSLLTLLTSAFQLSILSEVSLLKLPSISNIWYLYIKFLNKPTRMTGGTSLHICLLRSPNPQHLHWAPTRPPCRQLQQTRGGDQVAQHSRGCVRSIRLTVYETWRLFLHAETRVLEKDFK